MFAAVMFCVTSTCAGVTPTCNLRATCTVNTTNLVLAYPAGSHTLTRGDLAPATVAADSSMTMSKAKYLPSPLPAVDTASEKPGVSTLAISVMSVFTIDNE